MLNNDSVISSLFKFAGYTYGPLLGLYAFGILTKYSIKDSYVWIIALLSPVICVLLNFYSESFNYINPYVNENLDLKCFIKF